MKQHVVPSELMLAPEVDARVPYSRAHLYRLEDQGEFPNANASVPIASHGCVMKLSDGSQTVWRASHE